MSDEFDTDGILDGEDPEDDGNDQVASGDDESDDSPEGGDGDQDGAADGEEKRVNDLMSKWQQAEARAEKLERRLAALESSNAAGPQEGSEQWIRLMQDQARDQVFRSDPRLEKYGLGPSDIEGDTPEQMRSSAKRWGEIMGRIETDATNAALKKHGLSADVKGGSNAKLPDFGKMSDEDFDALIDRTKGRL